MFCCWYSRCLLTVVKNFCTIISTKMAFLVYQIIYYIHYCWELPVCACACLCVCIKATIHVAIWSHTIYNVVVLYEIKVILLYMTCCMRRTTVQFCNAHIAIYRLYATKIALCVLGSILHVCY